MAQKFGIVILLLIIAALSVVIYWHLKFNSQPQLDSEPVTIPNSSQSPVSNNSAISSTSTNPDKPQPTEAQIEERVTTVLETIKVEGKTRRLTSEELMYLANPRNAAIQDLTK
jgi:hypothetical protein